MSNELAAVVTTYEAELVGAGRMSRDDGSLDERKASDRSQGLQTTSRREPGSCPTGEHQALHYGTAQKAIHRMGSSTRQACRRRQDRDRRLNSSQVADAWISPLTNLQPPSASGGNMYVQRSHREPGSGARL